VCIKMSEYFTVKDEVTRHYRRFNAEGRQLTVRIPAPPPPPPPNTSGAEQYPAQYFADSVDELFEYSLRDLDPSDMVGISIHNANHQQDRPIGLSFRKRDHISRDVLWSVFEVTQSNARYQALDTLTFYVHSVKMPVGFWKVTTSKGRPLSMMAHLKRSRVEVKATENCQVHALVIAKARVTNDPDYKAYRFGAEVLAQGQRVVAGVGRRFQQRRKHPRATGLFSAICLTL